MTTAPAGSCGLNMVCFALPVLVFVEFLLLPPVAVTPPVLRFVVTTFLVADVGVASLLAGLSVVRVAEAPADVACRATRASGSGSHSGHDTADTTGVKDSRATASWLMESVALMVTALSTARGSSRWARETPTGSGAGTPLELNPRRTKSAGDRMLFHVGEIGYAVVSRSWSWTENTEFRAVVLGFCSATPDWLFGSTKK